MAYAGHVLDMIKRMKQNRKLRAHQSKFKNEYGADLKFGMTYNPDFGKDPNQEIINENQLSLQRELRKMLIINAITFVGIIVGMWYLFI